MGRKRVKRPDKYSDAANLYSNCKSGRITISEAMLGKGFTKREFTDPTTRKRVLRLSKRLLVPTTIKTVATTAISLLSDEHQKKPLRLPPNSKNHTEVRSQWKDLEMKADKKATPMVFKKWTEADENELTLLKRKEVELGEPRLAVAEAKLQKEQEIAVGNLTRKLGAEAVRRLVEESLEESLSLTITESKSKSQTESESKSQTESDWADAETQDPSLK